MVQKAPFILFFIFLTLSCDKDDSQHQRYEPIPVNIAVPAVFSQLLPEHDHERYRADEPVRTRCEK